MPERFIVPGVVQMYISNKVTCQPRDQGTRWHRQIDINTTPLNASGVAQQIQDSADKTMLLDMAEMWRRLAEIAENMKRANAGDDKADQSAP